MVNLDELTYQARELQPLPASAVRLAELVASWETGLGDICEVIAYDQALTLSLLRAANSAASGIGTAVTQVHEAVFRLGAARALALAMGANARGLLKQNACAYGLSEGALWRHSVASAAAAETLSDFALAALPAETFTAALLHDVGKLVMSRFLSPHDLEMIHRAQTDGGLDPLAAESQVLGVHHGELGGIIAQHWKLPERIVKGVTYHHTPADGNDLICDAVYSANLVAKSIEGSPPPSKLNAEALARLGLSEFLLDEASTLARDTFENISARYNTA
jgi:putative nucleotidyltransferase with HDIG domain